MTNHPNRTTDCRPLNHLRAAGKRYPDAWKQIDEFRAARGKDLPDWPDWCFLPMSGVYAIVSGGGDNRVSLEMIRDVGRLAALSAWRVTQGIYRFDDGLYQELTVVSDDVKDVILGGIPQWCVYIETPGMKFCDNSVHGFFAHLEFDVGSGIPELRLVLDCEKELFVIPLHLEVGGLIESLDEMAVYLRKNAAAYGIPTVGNCTQYLRSQVEPMISLLIHLCLFPYAAVNEYGQHPTNPKPKRTKKGWRLFPADNPTVWRVV